VLVCWPALAQRERASRRPQPISCATLRVGDLLESTEALALAQHYGTAFVPSVEPEPYVNGSHAWIWVPSHVNCASVRRRERYLPTSQQATSGREACARRVA